MKVLNILERSRREADSAEGERWLLLVLWHFDSIFKPWEGSAWGFSTFTPCKALSGTHSLSNPSGCSSLGFIHPSALPLPRPGLESITDRVTLSDYEARRLLNALVKEFIQMTAEELEQASEGNR